MSLENARNHLKKYGKDGDIILFDESSATVKEAAADLHYIPVLRSERRPFRL